jgi:hypothetical protein
MADNKEIITGETVKILRCLRCGHKWIPRKTVGLPIICPSPDCRSPYWQVPRKKPKVTKKVFSVEQGLKNGIDESKPIEPILNLDLPKIEVN